MAKTRQVGVRVTAERWAELERRAAADDRSVSYIVDKALDAYLAQPMPGAAQKSGRKRKEAQTDG